MNPTTQKPACVAACLRGGTETILVDAPTATGAYVASPEVTGAFEAPARWPIRHPTTRFRLTEWRIGTRPTRRLTTPGPESRRFHAVSDRTAGYWTILLPTSPKLTSVRAIYESHGRHKTTSSCRAH